MPLCGVRHPRATAPQERVGVSQKGDLEDPERVYGFEG